MAKPPVIQMPPENVEAEMCAIGSVLHNSDVMDDCGHLRAEHFFSDTNRLIWNALISLCATTAPDPVTLADYVHKHDQIDLGVICEHIGKCLEKVPNHYHAKNFANTVISSWKSRQARSGCSDIVQMIDDGAHDDDVADRAEKVLVEVVERASVLSDISISDVMIDTWNAIESRIGKGEPSGIPTGWTDLDKLIVGVQPTELVIVAARPGVGKSAFAGCLAMSFARRGLGVLFISMEMSRQELGERMIALDSGVSGNKIKAGCGFDEWEVDAMLKSADAIGKLPIRIDEQPRQKLRQIAATARKMKRKYGLGLIVVDYLQLIRPDNEKIPREQQVSAMTRELKCLAKEIEIPILVLAQMNRLIDQRENKRPRLSDLRESGAIEQDADKVIFLHRPSIDDPEDRPGECELTIAKNRCGRMGIVALAYHDETTQFRDLSRFDAAEAAARAFDTARDWTR